MILKESELSEEARYKNIPKTDAVDRLLAYLDFELRAARMAYSERYYQLSEFRRQIKAKPKMRVKTFPWPGASNIVIPVIRIAGDAVKARIVNTLLAPTPFWACSSPASGSIYEPFARPWQNFMEWSSNSDLKLTELIEMIADQVVYLGECPVLIHWVTDTRKVTTYDPRTRKVVDRVRTFKDSPVIEPIILENWLEPWGICDSTDKPWLAHRVYKRVGELKTMAAQGLIYEGIKYDELISIKPPTEFDTWSDTRKIQWADVQVAELWQVNVDFDIDDDGFQENMIVLFSLETGVPLSIKYNYFWHQKKIYRKFYYLRDSDDRSRGDGLCHLLADIQEARSTFFNQRTDNITIANTKVYKTPKVGGLKPNTKIFPGMIIPLADPQSGLLEMDMGTVSPQSFANDNQLEREGEKISGVSDPQLGREIAEPRVSATSTLTAIQEGNKRFDMIIRLIRAEFAEIGKMVSQLYQQFQPRVSPEEIVSPEDLPFVQAILSAPAEDVERNLNINVNASSVSTNEEAERNNIQGLYQMIDGFYKSVMVVSDQLITNPAKPMAQKIMAIEMVRAQYTAIKELIYAYNLSDPTQFLYDPTEDLQEILDASGELAGTAGLDGIMAGLQAQPGMAGSPQALPPAQGIPMGPPPESVAPESAGRPPSRGGAAVAPGTGG